MQTLDQEKSTTVIALDSATCKTEIIRVLHVDDDASILEISKQMLMYIDNSLDINFAHTVSEAFEKLSSAKYDVVVSDYDMPVKNGLDFLKELKEKGNQIPFILFTGKGREEIAIKALNLGAEGYFNKQGSPETVYGELAHGIRAATVRKRAQEALRQSEEKFSKAFNSGPNAFTITRLSDGRIIEANDAVRDILGYDFKKIIGKTTVEANVWVTPEAREAFVAELTKVGTISNRELTLRRKDGRLITVYVSASIIEVDGEKCLTFSYVDVTAKRAALDSLIEEKTRFTDVVNNTGDWVWEVDSEGKYVYCSSAVQRLLGYKEQEVLGKHFSDFVLPEEKEQLKVAVLRVFGSRDAFKKFVDRHVNKDGSIVILESSATPFYGKDGTFLGYRGVSHDITEREKAERALNESEEKYRNLFENSPDVMLTFDLAGKITSVNKAIVEHGFKTDEIVGKSLFNFVPIQYVQPMIAGLKSISSGNSTHGEIEILTPRGTIWAEYNSNPIWNGGKVVGYQTIMRDVTEHKKVEEALLKANLDWERTFNCVPDFIAILDNKYKIVRVNEPLAKQLGIPPEQAVGLTCYRCVHDMPLPPDFCPFTQTLADGLEHMEEVHEPRLGGDFLVSTTPLKDAQGHTVGSVHVARNITNIKKAEDELRQRVLERNALLDSVRSVLNAQDFESAAHSIFCSCKKTLGAKAGYVALLSEDGSENKVLFLDSGGLECTVDPKLPMPIRGLRERAYNACNVVYENHFPKSDFTKFLPKGHVALSNVMFAPLIISNKAVGVMGLANKPTDFTDVDAKLAVAFGEFAAIALNNSYSADAIQKRDDEITKALERLSESNLKLENATEKLQVIGSLTRHDARNKLAVLNNYIYLLRKKIVDNTDANKFLTAMDEATKQLLAILEFEKVYEQIGSEILVYANVEKLFAEASLLITDFKGIKLECKCNGLEVLTDSLLRQLLYNLMDNTLKYGEKTTLIRLSCRKDENSMLLIYEDDGVGMSDEVRFHLFEKGFGKGTGFGLYMAKRIIEDYGWSIKENGKFGVGAKFTIKIPENKFRLKEST